MLLSYNELERICIHTSIAIVSTQLNGFNYCNLTFIILFNINLLSDSEVQKVLNTKQSQNSSWLD